MLLGIVLLAATQVTQVPDPRPRGSWVVDLPDTLSATAESEINTRVTALRAATGAEVAVVVVQDVSTPTPKDFSTQLFNHWQLGTRERNDGVLVLLVLGQRRLEIETGIGMEAKLPDSWLVEMQQRAMVPKFKRGDFGSGIEAGIREIDTRLRGTDLAAVQPLGVTGAPSGDPVALGAQPNEPAQAGNAGDALFCGGTLFALLGGGAGSVFGFLWLGRRARRCPKCQSDTLLLDELSDDAHLTESQKKEESIGSVDWQVYVCPGCDFTRTVAKNKWFSGYEKCRGCGAKTMKSASTTLVYATYDHGGQVRVDESCVQCPFRNSYTRSTPRKTRPSSSSSSRSSFGGSRSSGGGGGRSRGGGGGSSW